MFSRVADPNGAYPDPSFERKPDSNLIAREKSDMDPNQEYLGQEIFDFTDVPTGSDLFPENRIRPQLPYPTGSAIPVLTFRV